MLGIIKFLFPSSLRVSIVDYLYSSPMCIKSNRLFNLVGGNIVRLLWFRIQFLFRAHKVKRDVKYESLVNCLRRDGIVRIENFLSDEEFSEVLNEYHGLYEEFHATSAFEFPIQKRFFLGKSRLEHADKFRVKGLVLKKFLLDRAPIKYVVQRYTRRKINLSPSIVYGEEFYKQDDLGKKSQNKTVMPHYDVPYHSLKVFFYLNDVDEKNGAFHYSYGSHRFGWRRLLLEYFTSNNIAAKRYPQVNYENCSFFNYYENNMKPIVGKANTLIIFDAMGIHKRGEFSTTQPRQTAQASYRMLDSWANSCSGLIKRFVNL